MELWPHQIKGVADTLAAINSGQLSLCLTSPTGCGKTRIMWELIKHFQEINKRTVLYTNRKLLVEQTSRVLDQAGIRHGVRSAGYLDQRERAVQISSVQTEAARSLKGNKWDLHRADLVLIDECFVGPTKVSCPEGEREIRNMRIGDLVYNAFGIGVVISVLSKKSTNLVEVKFTDGTKTICTPNHKFFTERGWTEASSLVQGEMPFNVQDVHLLLEEVQLQRQCFRENVSETEFLQYVLCSEAQEPYGFVGGQKEDAGNPKSYWAQTKHTGREWENTSICTGNPVGNSRKQLAHGVHCGNRIEKDASSSYVLQGGHSKPGHKDRYRSRWFLASRQEARSGCKERGFSKITRVESVSPIEQRGCQDVYDLEVSGHPSYFANGKLVHNCHIQKGKTVRELIKRHKNAAVIGFTATPLGIGEIYENLIVAGKTSDGRKCGALVPCVHYGCDEPDMRNIKIAEGKELTEKQQVSAMRRPGLFGRIWDNFCKINPDKRATVCFGPDVEGSIWIAEQFTRKGIRAAHVDGECVWVDGQLYANSKGILQDIIGESKDGGITVLTNRFVLREGVDLPWLSHGIFACVFGQTGTYLQAGGRLLRSYPELDHVTIQDHGGNYWRHSSLNIDREWDLSMSEPVYQATNRERLAHLPPERQPFLCPNCGRTWTSGITCREEYGGCGFVLTSSKRSRPVVTELGDLVELPGSFYQPKKEFKGRDGQYKWKQMYWRARSDRWNATFRQAEAMFAYENFGMWPDRKWPFMPKRYLDLWRKVKDVKQEDLYQ